MPNLSSRDIRRLSKSVRTVENLATYDPSAPIGSQAEGLIVGGQDWQLLKITGAISSGLYPATWYSYDSLTDAYGAGTSVKALEPNGVELVEDWYYLGIAKGVNADGDMVFVVVAGGSDTATLTVQDDPNTVTATGVTTITVDTTTGLAITNPNPGEARLTFTGGSDTATACCCRAFLSVSFGDGSGSGFLTIDGWDQIPFSTIGAYALVDPGNNWDATDNVFVVPVTGFYKATVNARLVEVGGGASYAIAAGLRADDSVDGVGWFATNGLREGAQYSVVLPLSKGDRLFMYAHTDSATSAGNGKMVVEQLPVPCTGCVITACGNVKTMLLCTITPTDGDCSGTLSMDGDWPKEIIFLWDPLTQKFTSKRGPYGEQGLTLACVDGDWTFTENMADTETFVDHTPTSTDSDPFTLTYEGIAYGDCTVTATFTELTDTPAEVVCVAPTGCCDSINLFSQGDVPSVWAIPSNGGGPCASFISDLAYQMDWVFAGGADRYSSGSFGTASDLNACFEGDTDSGFFNWDLVCTDGNLVLTLTLVGTASLDGDYVGVLQSLNCDPLEAVFLFNVGGTTFTVTIVDEAP